MPCKNPPLRAIPPKYKGEAAPPKESVGKYHTSKVSFCVKYKRFLNKLTLTKVLGFTPVTP